MNTQYLLMEDFLYYLEDFLKNLDGFPTLEDSAIELKVKIENELEEVK